MTSHEKLVCREMANSAGINPTYLESWTRQNGVSPSALLWWVSGHPEKWMALMLAVMGHQDERNNYFAEACIAHLTA
jgi:hypothetical protein